jgi:hypothetical protein
VSKAVMQMKEWAEIFQGKGHYKEDSVFDIHVTFSHVKFLIIKPTRCTDFSNLMLE